MTACAGCSVAVRQRRKEFIAGLWRKGFKRSRKILFARPGRKDFTVEAGGDGAMEFCQAEWLG